MIVALTLSSALAQSAVDLFALILFARPLDLRFSDLWKNALMIIAIALGIFAIKYLGIRFLYALAASIPLFAFYLWGARRILFSEALYLGGVFFLCLDASRLISENVMVQTVFTYFPSIYSGWSTEIYLICYALFAIVITMLVRRWAVLPETCELTFKQCLLIYLPLIPYAYIRSGIYDPVGVAPTTHITLMLFLCLVPTFVVIIGNRNVLINKTRQNELLEIEAKLNEQHQQYLIKQETIDALNKRYHEMKHYISSLRTGTNLTEKDIDEFNRDLLPYSTFVQTGSPIVDVIFMEKFRVCNANSIRLAPYVDARQLGFISSLNLCTLFGNALDNAIEASLGIEDMDLREIRVKVSAKAGFIILNFFNRYSGELQTKNERLISEKTSESDHGHGLSNMRRAAETYGGHLAHDADDGEFNLSIIIPVPEAD